MRDAATLEPVPCVTLRTVHWITLRSDRNGVIAFYEPGLMNAQVWFETLGPPWELPDDWLGFPGQALLTVPGGAGELLVTQTGQPTDCAPGDSDSQLVQSGIPPEMHGVRVLDAETERGVPLVELRGNGRTWVTDSAGWAAIYEPGWLGTTEDFELVSHGYTSTSATLDLSVDGRSEVPIERRNPAERIYRVTGGGIYRDSVLLGEPTPIAEPVLNGQVVGLDSTHTAVHEGQLFHVWGDTLRASYPLGHFKTAGATSVLPDDGGLDPDQGVDLRYFENADGFSRPVADVADEGLVWTSGLVSIPSDSGPGELIAPYANVGGRDSTLGAGMLRWDPTIEAFEAIASWTTPPPAEPSGTAFLERGSVYFTDIVRGDGPPYRVVRSEASLDALSDPDAWANWTARDLDGELVRSAGRAVYSWRPGAAVTTEDTPGVRPDELLYGHMRDPFGDTEVGDHIGSVFWNQHLGRYLRIFARPFGDDAFLGETWLSVSDTPMGPWAWARKVVTHDDYSFYNPRHHPEFDADGGRIVYFQGTYSATFASTDRPTPRYDYNQVMYRLDLDRVPIPVPIYGEGTWTRANLPPGADAAPARFFALDRPAPGARALRWTGADCAPRELDPDGAGEIAFWVMETDDASPSLIPLPGAPTLGYVWPNPIDVAFPVSAHPPPLVVNAGPDRCLPNPSIPVLLRAGSSASDGIYRWTWDGGEAAGPLLEPELAEGVTVFTLTVTDADGTIATDVVVVQVGDEGCGCSAGAAEPSTLAWLLPLLLLRRRPTRSRGAWRSDRAGAPFAECP